MKFNYYGPDYPNDTEEHKLPGFKLKFENEAEEFESYKALRQFEMTPIDRNPWIYRNFVMSSERMDGLWPEIDWRFRWYDGDEEYWRGFIDSVEVASLHRGGYSLTYGTLDESDSWEKSNDCFFYYAYLRILEEMVSHSGF